MSASSGPVEGWRTLWDLIDGIRIAMLTSQAPDGSLRARPLTTLWHPAGQAGFQPPGAVPGAAGDAEGEWSGLDLWFFVPRAGDTAQDIGSRPAVGVAYARPEHDEYVSIVGTARLVEDRAQRHALWSLPVQAWFPNGPDDPEVALIAVRVEAAEYWRVTENRLTQLLKLARRIVTPDVQDTPGEHQRLQPASGPGPG